jgi:hypothetical protein
VNIKSDTKWEKFVLITNLRGGGEGKRIIIDFEFLSKSSGAGPPISQVIFVLDIDVKIENFRTPCSRKNLVSYYF